MLLLGLSLLRIHHPLPLLLGLASLLVWYQYKATNISIPQRIIWGQERTIQLVYDDKILSGDLSQAPLSNALFTRLSIRLEDGNHIHHLVYADSLTSEQYRKLRVRSKLERKLANNPEPF